MLYSLILLSSLGLLVRCEEPPKVDVKPIVEAVTEVVHVIGEIIGELRDEEENRESCEQRLSAASKEVELLRRENELLLGRTCNDQVLKDVIQDLQHRLQVYTLEYENLLQENTVLVGYVEEKDGLIERQQISLQALEQALKESQAKEVELLAALSSNKQTNSDPMKVAELELECATLRLELNRAVLEEAKLTEQIKDILDEKESLESKLLSVNAQLAVIQGRSPVTKLSEEIDRLNQKLDLSQEHLRACTAENTELRSQLQLLQ